MTENHIKLLEVLTPFDVKTSKQLNHYQFLLSGQVGDLECLLSYPVDKPSQTFIAVVCHPHPLYGGSMNNKVVYTLAKTLNKHNIPVIRFNFRGVARSQGQYDNGVGEKDDLATVVRFMQKLFPGRRLWLAGFSFGAYIAISQQQALQAKQLITVAPPVTSFNFNELPEPRCPWLLVQGLADEIIDAAAVLNWANSLQAPPNIQTLQDTSHFFHHRLVDLGKILDQQLFSE